jgi:predicted ATPase
MIFYFVTDKSKVPARTVDAVYLIYDNWDDYGFRTKFGVTVFDENGKQHDLPRLNIGFAGQTTSDETHTMFKEPFEELPKGYFSLSGSVDFYKTLYSDFTLEWREDFLRALRDMVRYPELLERVKGEEVVEKSLLRSVRIEEVKDQYTSVLRGEVFLTNFDFGFELPPSEKFAGFDLQFKVKANSVPSTNMHALIGRNGVGKTTYLNAMVKAVSPRAETDAEFYTTSMLPDHKLKIDPTNYFGSFISVAFSAFDPFEQPPPSEEEGVGFLYSYVGLIDHSQERGAQASKHLKSDETLHAEFVQALKVCFADKDRKTRWEQAIATLESDENFADMKLRSLTKLSDNELERHARKTIEKMSSGHTIVILSITLLVARVNEKTLVLFDEPESHLQPPLLSALMRSLAQLLKARNAVAIIATHSPVVLQEIPKSCVWKVSRLRLASTNTRPEKETFGENVGTLTRDVFGLDVEKSGFHTILADLVKSHNPEGVEAYDVILEQIGGNLGYEAKGILKAMIANHIEHKPEL